MAQLRTLAAELARLLASIAAPIYVLDDERRVVYANAACTQWLGVEIEDLLGQTCSYHSSPIVEPLEGKAAGLCPPPEILAGARGRGVVASGGGNGQLVRRQAEFIPLFDEAESCAAVLAIVAPVDLSQFDLPDGAVLSADDRGDDAAAESAALHEQLREFHDRLRAPWQMDRLVGDSPAMQRVRSQVRLAWGSRAAVLVVGPPGSGRQHVAKAIHYGAAPSPRPSPVKGEGEIEDGPRRTTGDTRRFSDGVLVPVSCSTLGTELLRSTLSALLGQSRRAADPARQAGKPAPQPESAASTLLLNDVHELPSAAQAELAEGLARDPTALRIVSTAIAPLEAFVSRGEFRGDLACALSTIVVQLPPLAERREDVPLLAQMFLEELNAEGPKQLHGFSPEALDQLAAYPWPGNIDELAAMVREAHGRAEGPQVGPGDLPRRIYFAAAASRHPPREAEPIKLEEFLAGIELELIQRALRLSKGNKTKAARLLGLTRPRLYRRMVQLGLEKGE